MYYETIEGYRLSLQQRWLWRVNGEKGGGRGVCAIRIQGRLDRCLLRKAVDRLVELHEVLRTSFRRMDGIGVPIQVIEAAGAVAFCEEEIEEQGAGQRWAKVEAEIRAAADACGEAKDQAPIFCKLLAVAEDDSVLLISVSALCADQIALVELCSQIVTLYEALSGEGEQPDELVQYVDYSEWQNTILEEEDSEEGSAHWRLQQARGDSPLVLPLEKRLRRVTPEPDGFERFFFEIDSRLADDLEGIAKQCESDLATLLLSAWAVLLWKLTEKDEVAIHTLFGGRKYENLTTTIGVLAKHLPIVVRGARDLRFDEVVERISISVEEARSWEEYFVPGSEEAGNEKARSELEDRIGFGFAEWPDGKEAVGASFKVFDILSLDESLKLKLSCVRAGASLRAELHYSTARFSAGSIAVIASQLLTLLETISIDALRPIGELNIVGKRERELLVEKWNDTSMPFSGGLLVHRLFEEQAQMVPDRIALVYEDEHISFRELNRRANQLAHHLRRRGVGPDTLVVLCAERSAMVITALLGIVKAGGAYVPIDPGQPGRRLKLIIDDCAAELVLTQDRHLADLEVAAANTISLDSEWDQISRESGADPESEVQPHNLAYMVYTSGTSGRPKAAMIEHASLMNLLGSLETRVYKGHEGCLNLSVNAPLAFDSSVKQVIQMARGRTLIVIPEDVRRDGAALLDYITRMGVDSFDCTPSQLRLIVGGPDEQSMKMPATVLVGGEAIDETLWRLMARDRRTSYFNVYGPSECTVDATVALVEESAEAPVIGRPIPNVRIYVLAGDQEPAGIGVRGEIFIAGEGVGRGYWGRSDLTAEKFLPDPFPRVGGERLYRTGDTGRYREGGLIEYLGRTDDQVKLRGFRVELREIESVLSSHPEVKESAVVLREDEAGRQRLVAYFAPASGQRGATSELRSFLKERLPDYMLPALVLLKSLPVTRNGKVDRKALPPPQEIASEDEEQALRPQSIFQEVLVQIWSEVLGLRTVAADDSFFEVGGHSLLATQIISRVREAFKVEVPLRALFDAPSVAGFAERIEAEKRGGGGVLPPIERASETDELPLSYAQQRLWFLSELEPESAAYNCYEAVKLSGEVSIAALEQAIEELICRHEVLRTRIEVRDGRGAQVVEEWKGKKLEVIDLERVEEARREQEARRIGEQEARRPFDLRRGPMIRVKAVKMSEREYVILLTMHHVVSDGWSLGIVIREIVELYRANREGERIGLEEMKIQYGDYARWQRRWIGEEVMERQMKYWRKELGRGGVAEITTDRRREERSSGGGGREQIEISEAVVEKLREMSRREGVTMFMVLLAGLKAVMRRWTGEEEIRVGTVVAGRTRKEIEGLIGFFVNTLVIKSEVKGEMSFRELVRRVREVSLEAHANQDVPFEKLVEELEPEREVNKTPLFQVMFVLQNASQEDLALPGAKLSSFAVDAITPAFDLSMSLTDSGNTIRGIFEYDSDLFDRATIQRMVGHYEKLLESVASDPDQSICELPIIGEVERQQLLDWSIAAKRDEETKCAHELFEEQAGRTPDAIAVVSGEEALTFAELNRRANQLGRYLRRHGAGPDSLAGILMDRSLDIIVGMLGIMKTGGAYLPLDLAHPDQRLSFMLENAGAEVVITRGGLAERIATCGLTVIDLDERRREIEQEEDTNPAVDASPDNLAYVIYTSGSTGTPKGVMVAHRSMVNFVQSATAVYGYKPGDRILQFASIGFDASIEEIYPCLFYGFTLVLRTDSMLSTPSVFLRTSGELGLTVWDLPTAYWRELASRMEPELLMLPRSLGLVIVGGERIDPSRFASWREQTGNCVRFINTYGPTEATVSASAWEAPVADERLPLREIPIGRPFSNFRTYLLDARFEFVPMGVTGELHIGGVGPARGYLNLPRVTAEMFIPDPFSDQPGSRMYRTGDLTRYAGEGDIEFLGRSDDQLKVRGYRIELGEIETLLCTHSRVREAVVIAREGEEGEKDLVAYVVPAEGKEVTGSELRTHLKSRLPGYMIPRWVMKIESVPVNANGKIDKPRLPDPEQELADEEISRTAPRNPIEEILAGIWNQVLRLERIGVEDNFFDIGGHSLLAMQIISRVREAFKVEVPLRALFDAPSVAGLAERIEAEKRGGGGVLPPIERASETDELPLSYAQQRLWFLSELEPESAAYNCYEAVKLSGEVSVAALEQAIGGLIARHEVLRTRIEVRDGRGVQVVEEWKGRKLEVIDLERVEEGRREEEARRIGEEEARRPFDLRRGPMIRVKAVKMSEREYVILLTMHHVVSDGWSMGIVVREIVELYRANREGERAGLEEMKIQYGDYARWQRKWIGGEVVERQMKYWRKEIGRGGVTEIATDRRRGERSGGGGGRELLEIGEAVVEKLREMSRREGVTMFMVLLAGLKAVMRRLTGEEEIRVGTVVAGRTRKEIEGLIGFFVNTLVIKSEVRGEMSFRELVRRVREVSLEAHANQEVPFEKLVEELEPERAVNKTPLFQVMFVHQNAPDNAIEVAGARISPLSVDNQTAKFDLTFSLTERARSLVVSLEYKADLFDAATVRRILAHYQTMLEEMTRDLNTRVNDVRLLTDAQSGGLTAEAFPDAGLSQADFEELISQITSGSGANAGI